MYAVFVNDQSMITDLDNWEKPHCLRLKLAVLRCSYFANIFS